MTSATTTRTARPTAAAWIATPEIAAILSAYNCTPKEAAGSRIDIFLYGKRGKLINVGPAMTPEILRGALDRAIDSYFVACAFED